MISTVSTCENGHFTVNTQDNVLGLFASHDSCIGSLSSDEGAHLCKLKHTSMSRYFPPNPSYSVMHFNFIF